MKPTPIEIKISERKFSQIEQGMKRPRRIRESVSEYLQRGGKIKTIPAKKTKI